MTGPRQKKYSDRSQVLVAGSHLGLVPIQRQAFERDALQR